MNHKEPVKKFKHISKGYVIVPTQYSYLLNKIITCYYKRDITRNTILDPNGQTRAVAIHNQTKKTMKAQ